MSNAISLAEFELYSDKMKKLHDPESDFYRQEVVEMENGKRNGVTVFCWPNGQRKTYAEFKDDLLNGIFMTWHENGDLATTTHYQNNYRAGTHLEYQENDKMICSIQYPDSPDDIVPGQPYLSKTYYDKNGEPDLILKYGANFAVKDITRHGPR